MFKKLKQAFNKMAKNMALAISADMRHGERIRKRQAFKDRVDQSRLPYIRYNAEKFLAQNPPQGKATFESGPVTHTYLSEQAQHGGRPSAPVEKGRRANFSERNITTRRQDVWERAYDKRQTLNQSNANETYGAIEYQTPEAKKKAPTWAEQPAYQGEMKRLSEVSERAAAYAKENFKQSDHVEISTIELNEKDATVTYCLGNKKNHTAKLAF